MQNAKGKMIRSPFAAAPAAAVIVPFHFAF
jgi:hypothetical protein